MLDGSCLKGSCSAMVIGCNSRAVQKLLENDLEIKGFEEGGEKIRTISFFHH